jgi:serine/threonine protein phosphatase 1
MLLHRMMDTAEAVEQQHMNQAADEITSTYPGERAASATYAIGDLHGEVTLLRQLLAQLAPRSQDTLIFLGDYLDRGEDALGTIETLANVSTLCHCIFLRGNHDEAWLETWNGSAFTRCPHIPGSRPIWDQYQGLIPPAIGEFLAGTRVRYEDGYAWYAHAGAQPGIPFWESPPEVFVWGTAGFLGSSYDWGKPVIIRSEDVLTLVAWGFVLRGDVNNEEFLFSSHTQYSSRSAGVKGRSASAPDTSAFRLLPREWA